MDSLGTLAVVVLEPGLEQELADGVVQTPDGAYLGLDPGRAEALVRAVRDTMEHITAIGHRPVLVCSPKVRRHLRALTAHAVPRLVVLSYNEILPSTTVETVGVVELVVEGSLA